MSKMGDGSSSAPSVMQMLAAAGAAVVGLAVLTSKMGSGSNADGEVGSRNNSKGGRMMKAPGGGGTYIPRAEFEENPQRYFSDLRAGKDEEVGSRSNATGERMMKAPGGGGTYIPRAGFEENPQRYFSDMRTGKKGK